MVFNELKNFPEDVLEQWITPYAKQVGWPPNIGIDGLPIDRWRYLFSLKPMSWWQQGEWVKCKGHLSIRELTASAQDVMVKMAHSYLTGTPNEYSNSISDMTSRLASIGDYLQAHKQLPCAPILYESDGGYNISDGNHRLCMYYICYGYFNLPTPKELDILVDQEIEYWLYRSPQKNG